MKRAKTILVAPVLLVTFLAGTIASAYISQPDLYLSAVSPDGAWRVELLREHRHLLLPWPVDILVRVRDKQSHLAFERHIYIVDRWDQAEAYSSKISFAGGDIIVGPGRMYEDGPGEFVINMSDLKGMWLYQRNLTSAGLEANQPQSR
jgi:hypothetical protein